MTEHLSLVHGLLSDYEASVKSEVAQAFRRQDLKIGTIEQKISEGLGQLCHDDMSLQSMFDEEQASED